MGNSASSEIINTQIANAEVMQQFRGTCNINCSQSIKNSSIVIKNSSIGGNVGITQLCTVDGNCIIGSAMAATTSILLKSSNMAKATAASLFSGGIFNNSNSSINNFTKSNQFINQSNNQNCDQFTMQNMENVNIYASGSNIGGNVSLEQTGNVKANCVLKNTMSASLTAMQLATNSATSGKDKFSAKLKSKQTWAKVAIVGSIVGGVVAIVAILARVIAGPKTNDMGSFNFPPIRQMMSSARQQLEQPQSPGAGSPGAGSPGARTSPNVGDIVKQASAEVGQNKPPS